MNIIKVLFAAFLLVGAQSYYAAEKGTLPDTDDKQGINKTATSSVDPNFVGFLALSDTSAEPQWSDNAATAAQPEKHPGTPYSCPPPGAVKAAPPLLLEAQVLVIFCPLMVNSSLSSHP